MVKNPPANAENPGSVPGLGRSPRVVIGSAFQYSCLENPMDLGVCQATVHRVAKKVRHDLVTKQQKQEQDNNNVT